MYSFPGANHNLRRKRVRERTKLYNISTIVMGFSLCLAQQAQAGAMQIPVCIGTAEMLTSPLSLTDAGRGEPLVKEIIAQFSAESSGPLRNRETSPATFEVLSALREAGASIKPLHAGSDDPTLSRYFVIRVQDDAKAEELALRLRSLEPTKAAYIKPHEEAP